MKKSLYGLSSFSGKHYNQNVNGSAGFPVFGTEVIVVDPETHERLSPKLVGLVLVRSTSEFLEYDKRPDQTRENFKISLDAVKRKIRISPFIIDCAAVISEYGGSIEQIAAFIKTDAASSEEIKYRTEAAGTISHFELPSAYILVDKIPYKTAGDTQASTASIAEAARFFVFFLSFQPTSQPFSHIESDTAFL